MLHLNPNVYKTNKVFLELRFKESFKLPLNDTKYTLLDKFIKKYPSYNTENPESISMINHERQQQLHIQLNRIVIDWDKPSSIEDFYKSALADCNFILKTLEVDEIIRIGIRTLNSFEGNNQQAITEFIFRQYMTTKFKSPSFADEYFNPSVQMAGRKGKLFFNLSLGYQQEQIIEADFNKQGMNQIIRDLLLVDLDSFRDKIKTTKLQSFFADVKNLNSHLPDYILSIKE